MRSPAEFRDTYDKKEIRTAIPNQPISSLREIQYLYGKLYTLGTVGADQYAAYLTPDEAQDLLEEPKSLVVVRVDLSTGDPQLANDAKGGVWITTYTDELIRKVAHSKYPPGQAVDHSITHQSGRYCNPERIADYAVERLSRWPNDSVVRSTAETHPEGELISKLAQLGTDDAVVQKIRDKVIDEITKSQAALISVQVRRGETGEFLWPGEINVLMDAMRDRKISKLVSKGDASNSAGQAVDLVTGESTRTVGTADDPLNYFLTRQLEKFPGFDPEQAWRTHPLSEDTAVTLANSRAFMDASSFSAFGARIYLLPYLRGEMSVDEIYALYNLLYRATSPSKSENNPTVPKSAHDKSKSCSSDLDNLRYFATAVVPRQKSRFDVVAEAPNANLRYPLDISESHAAVLQSGSFSPSTERTSPMPTNDNWLLLTGDDFLDAVVSGRYFYETYRLGDDVNNASADDHRLQALFTALSGGSLSVEQVLTSYVDRILQENQDSDRLFPTFLVASQYTQLQALWNTDHNLLTTKDSSLRSVRTAHNATGDCTQSQPFCDYSGFRGAKKLNHFIDACPFLATVLPNRASFILGVLVGAVTSYQRFIKKMSTTAVDQYPIQSVTRPHIDHTAKKMLKKAVDEKSKIEAAEGNSGIKYGPLITDLQKEVVESDRTSWNTETTALRFWYAVGITYGLNDRELNQKANTL